MSENPEMIETHAPAATAPWDPFQLMDRLDEEALKKELEGVASNDLVYVVKEGGQEIVGLSKQGVDECCMALVSQGQVIREEDLQYEVLGEGEEREALFKVKAARFAVSPDGTEVRLDQVIGVKRQPLYFEKAALDLDAKAPSKKYKGRTYRELLRDVEGRDYLEWMSENFGDADIREFVKRILTGEELTQKRTRNLNPHWYEHGAMKAARNARFRLIPGNVRAQVIATARQSGQARVVEAPLGRAAAKAQPSIQPAAGGAERGSAPQVVAAQAAIERTMSSAHAEAPDAAMAAPTRVGPYAPTEKQVAFFQRLAESPVFTEEERKRAMDWLATKATRQTIKDQIDWLKRQVETRKGQAGSNAA
jgi:hypothetical protein